MQRWEISSTQAGMLAAGVVALTGHALAVTYFLQAGGRDAWLSGPLALPLGLIAIWSYSYLGRLFPGKTIVEYLPKLLGYLGYVVAVLYVVFLFAVLVFTIRLTMDWLVDSILPETPSWVMGFLYMASVYYLAVLGLDAIARTNQFTLPLLTVLGIFISVASMQAKDYRLLLPMFEKGLGPVFSTTLLGLGNVGELLVILMYNAYVAPGDRKKSGKAYALALLYAITTLTGPLAGSIAALGYRVAGNMTYPTFQHWLTVTFARFFERTDLLAAHQWLAGAYVRCALYLLMFGTGFNQLLRVKFRHTYLLAGAALAVVILSEIAFPTRTVFDEWVTRMYLPASAVLGVVLPPLLAAVAWARGMGRKAQGAKTHGA